MRENAEPVKMNDTDWKKLVDPYKEEAFETLKELVAINSVLDKSTATKEKPFGNGVDAALEYVAKLGEKLGFKVDRCDNYVTELTYGEGDKVLDVYAHVDVVPVKEENWTGNPFSLRLVDGNIMYGRGTSDDKGPGLSCLYAIKALMDNNMLGGYKLRFLFGGNEENDSLCLEHYFKEMKKEYPTYGFSPDAEYPLIYAEKSIYAYTADYSVEIKGVKPFSLGTALNVVMAEAECEITEGGETIAKMLPNYLKMHSEVKATFDGKSLKFLGHPYHGSTPWNGVNAGLHMLNFLGDVFGLKLLNDIFEDYNDGMGERFGGNFKDKYFTESSYNVGRIAFDGHKLTIAVNTRFPAGMDSKTVIDNVKALTKADVTLLGGSDGFVADPDSDFIKILLNSYQTETGDYTSKPLAIGGGTYARESRNSVAFGSQFIGRDYRMHGDDEFFPLSDFNDSMQIYAHAVYDLGEYIKTGKKPF
jgi:succinyl-diaminopimelate desuccinylase